MEYIDSIISLFPAVAVTAILIRYIVEAGKKLKIAWVIKNPGRTQAILNAIAWLGMGLAAHFGVEGQVMEVIRRLTDAWPSVVGLLELVVPMFLSILATKFAHTQLKKTEATVPPKSEAKSAAPAQPATAPAYGQTN